MDEKTLTALRGSIAKWRAIVDGVGVDRSGDNCPLCKAFPETDCRRCPVAKATGQANCEGTPYEAFHDWDISRLDGGAALNRRHTKGRRLAQAELDFLRGLLPEGVEP